MVPFGGPCISIVLETQPAELPLRTDYQTRMKCSNRMVCSLISGNILYHSQLAEPPLGESPHCNPGKQGHGEIIPARRSPHDAVQLHQLNALTGKLKRTGDAVAVAVTLLAEVVRYALPPRNWQQQWLFFYIRILPLHVSAVGEQGEQDAALFSRAAGLHSVQRHSRRVQTGIVVGAVHAAAERVVQQRLCGSGRFPKLRQFEVDAQPEPRDFKGRSGKDGGMDTCALIMQARPVDLIVVFPCPQADVAELPQADAAAHKMLVGV